MGVKTENVDLHEADDGDDLDDGENELCFTVAFDAKHIDGDDDAEEDRNKDSPGQRFVPVPDGETSSNNFEGQHSEPLHGVANMSARAVDNARGYTYFQPIAKPHDGSKNLVAQDEKEPAIGKMTASSPKAWHVQYSMPPMMEKANNRDAGPPAAKALPDATKRPVPRTKLSALCQSPIRSSILTY